MEDIRACEELQELLLLDGSQLPVVLFNGPICTTAGLYRVTDIDVDEARLLISIYGFESAVGHEASAQVFSNILETDVPMNRIEYVQKVGQKAIALKLKIRPEEGRILSASEMFQIGFVLQLMERLE
ncbi:MAG TPA: YddF family protein [Firmicutes bacterium]|jgi:hypothetical protein|nr:YddF family protein [Bacillota bacterium]